MPTAASAFDAAAERYDSDFTLTTIGARMRSAVRSRCAMRFAPGSRVLEMNCGTGEDALWMADLGVDVLATDSSPAMLEIARDKLTAHPRRASIRFQPLAWQELSSLDEALFDGALSNFGGLNCIMDLRAAACALATKLRPGAVAALCIMGPVVPWEWLWFLAHGDVQRAFRRLRRGSVVWSGIKIHYPSVAATRKAFSPEFKVLRVSAIGALLPPPYAEKSIGRFPRVIAALDRVERSLESRWPLPMLADHYLIELTRT